MRPKLNSITIGFSLRAHNFPLTAKQISIDKASANKSKKRSKGSKISQHIDIDNEKLNKLNMS